MKIGRGAYTGILLHSSFWPDLSPLPLQGSVCQGPPGAQSEPRTLRCLEDMLVA